jgi:hypothetical protein
MPRDFISLSDMPQAVLGITCDLCQRRKQFDVEALMREHGGDVKMPELLGRLVADCPRQRDKAFSSGLPGTLTGRRKESPRCWPSVNGGTSGLEYGAGKSPPLNCQVLQAGVS